MTTRERDHLGQMIMPNQRHMYNDEGKYIGYLIGDMVKSLCRLQSPDDDGPPPLGSIGEVKKVSPTGVQVDFPGFGTYTLDYKQVERVAKAKGEPPPKDHVSLYVAKLAHLRQKALEVMADFRKEIADDGHFITPLTFAHNAFQAGVQADIYNMCIGKLQRKDWTPEHFVDRCHSELFTAGSRSQHGNTPFYNIVNGEIINTWAGLIEKAMFWGA